MGEPKVVKIGDVAPPDFELPKLDQVIDKTIFLVDFIIDVSKFGEYAVIYTKGQGIYHTTSEPVIRQLKRLARYLSTNSQKLGKDMIVEAIVKAEKGEEGDYYTLTSKVDKKK